jgi:hypothetical protein
MTLHAKMYTRAMAHRGTGIRSTALPLASLSTNEPALRLALRTLERCAPEMCASLPRTGHRDERRRAAPPDQEREGTFKCAKQEMTQ